MNTKNTRKLVATAAVAALAGGGIAAAASAGADTSTTKTSSVTTRQGPGYGHGQGQGQGYGKGQGRHQGNAQGQRHGQGKAKAKGQGMGRGMHGKGRGMQGQGRAGAAHDPASALATLPVGTLSAAEEQTLKYMREEEKLAHDVYVKLAATSKLTAFTNISASETRHADAIKTLLERHDLADPAAGKPAGVFTDSTLQALYDKLVKDGSASVTAALRVGAYIEEQDIADIKKAIAATDEADLKLVYGNLLEGSKHHLSAFVRQLEQRGVDYEPQVLTEAQLKAYVG